MMRKYREVIKKPIITEKSLKLAREQNSYTFEVSRKASKGAIKDEVEKVYGVSVLKVGTATIPSKKKRIWRFGKISQRSPWKKAVVKLKEGDRIEGFEIE